MSMDTIISVRKKGTTAVFVNYIHVLIQEYIWTQLHKK